MCVNFMDLGFQELACVHFHAWMHYITRDLTKTGQLKKTEMEKQQLRNVFRI